MRGIRLLNANEVECRISEIDRQGRFLRLLLYKTVRTDAALLDETFGAANWQNDYRLLDEQLFCGISVRDEKGEWIWRWNVGTESNVDAEKGRASDAMKRAGFLWGIGTELYSAPEIKISASQCNIKEYNGKYRCYDRFDVAAIGYDEGGAINSLTITCNGHSCYKYGTKQTPLKDAQTPPPSCADCGQVIQPIQRRDGRMWDVPSMVRYSERRFQRPLCSDCMKKAEANGQ